MTPLELLSDGTVVERGNYRTSKVVLFAKGPEDIERWARESGAESPKEAINFLDEARAKILKVEIDAISRGLTLQRASTLLWTAMETFARRLDKKKEGKKPKSKNRKKIKKHLFKFILIKDERADQKKALIRTQGGIIYDLLLEFCESKNSLEFTHDDACKIILENMDKLDTVQNPAILWRYFRTLLKQVRLVKMIGRRHKRSKIGKLLEQRGEEASMKARERFMLECGEDVLDLMDPYPEP